MIRLSIIFAFMFSQCCYAQPKKTLWNGNWPQGTGPNGNFSLADVQPPESWSVVRDQGIAWKKTLPETGQSTVVVWNDRLFFTTLQEVKKNSELGQNIVAWCCDASTGKTIWTRELPGDYPLRLSGCFSDSSGPPAVTNGKHVCFFNASGKVSCFEIDGSPVWSKDLMAVGRSQPFLLGDQIVFTRQKYMPDENGNFTHDHKHAPRDQWTQLQAININTGQSTWTSDCGVNMGSVSIPHKLKSGKTVIVAGRGGGHSPPETPEGISMIDASNGVTLWTLPLPGFMSTMTFNIYNDHVLVFHDNEHLWVSVDTGEVQRRVSFLADINVRVRDGQDTWKSIQQTLPPPKKKRAIIQQSNVLAGKYHYFRSYTHPYLGRINADTGTVGYLQLPVQLKRSTDDTSDYLLWEESEVVASVVDALKNKKTKKPPQATPKTIPIHQWCFTPNEVRNSRGFLVMGDARSRHTGWGHHASQVPTVIGNRLYVPIMNGTVYVIDAFANKFDEKAIVSINDLGEVGKSFNRASLSFAGGNLFAHTIRDLICINGNQKTERHDKK